MPDLAQQPDGPIGTEPESTTSPEPSTVPPFLSYKAGSVDSTGGTIRIIYSISPIHIVYEVDGPIESSCVCVIHRGVSSLATERGNNVDLIKPKLAELRGVLYKCGDDATVRHRRGNIVTLALSSPDEAISKIDTLIADINTNYIDNFQKRILYLAGAFGILFIFSLGSIVTRILVIENEIPSRYETLQLILYIMTSGVIGGFISVSYKLKTILFEKAVPKYYFFIYGVERLFISILASVVLFFAIKANFIFGFVKDESNPFYGYILLGVLAGFSETLIPDLLVKIEKQGLQDKIDNK